MAEDFKSYDKTPILDALKNRWFRLSIKDLILPSVVVSLVLVCVIMAGLFGKTKNDLNDITAASTSALLGGSLCTDIGCLETATRAMEYRNTSIDPCEDFYEYACGNYVQARSFKLNGVFKSVLGDMYQDNQDKLIDLMEQPISQMHDYAAERKLKQFFQACNDMFTRDQKKGLPILSQVLPEIGGWKVLGNWQNTTWDLNSVLKKIQTDFWVDAFYDVTVQTDWYDVQKKSIVISPSGVGKYMYWNWYTNPRYEKNRQDYKKFIRRVGSLLVRDAVDFKVIASSPMDLDTLLDEFVNDTFAIESKIAQLTTDSDYTEDPYEEANKPSLGQLNTETNSVIDWVVQMSYMFNTVRVTGATKVVVTHKEYFKNITDMISSIPSADRNRVLHNYLIWRVAETYVQEMSWDYIHSNREMYVDLHNRQNFLGVFFYCFSISTKYMSDALASLYISRFFSKDSRTTVHDITDNIRQALKEQLQKTPWMDDATKKYANEKLDKVILKMGYPEWMDNVGYIDQMYNGLTVNLSDHFGNLLSGNQYHRALMNEDLSKSSNEREEWIVPVYSTSMYIYFWWNEIAAPAGILQFPVYSKRQPHSATFGSFGSILGHYFHHIVDEWGKWFDLNGDYMEKGQTWWSNQSLTAYETVKKCVSDVYSNITRTVMSPDGTPAEVKMRTRYDTTEAISWTNGVRLAFLGYKDWMNNLGLTEKILPGLGLTNEQVMFLAHAQTYCFDKEDPYNRNRMMFGIPTNDFRVNMAFGQLPEFVEAYKCKPDSKMNHATKCDYY